MRQTLLPFNLNVEGFPHKTALIYDGSHTGYSNGPCLEQHTPGKEAEYCDNSGKQKYYYAVAHYITCG